MKVITRKKVRRILILRIVIGRFQLTNQRAEEELKNFFFLSTQRKKIRSDAIEAYNFIA